MEWFGGIMRRTLRTDGLRWSGDEFVCWHVVEEARLYP
jgi:hypothetical protein